MNTALELPELSVVVPVYREEPSIPLFLAAMVPVLERAVTRWEILFALDPSPDRTEKVILEARERDPRIKLLRFSRRIGQPMATLGGLRHASGAAVIIMDVDLQDPPELITAMVARWRAGADVVYAKRRTRDGETWIKRLVAACGYRLIHRISEVSIPENTGDFRLLSRRAVETVCHFRESHGFLRGLVALAGFRAEEVLFDRPARAAGRGNYNRFFGSLRIGINGIICFSNQPLAWLWWLGAFCLLAAVAVLTAAGIGGLLGAPWTGVPLWLSGLVMLVCGVQLGGMALLGEYIGRIYDEVKRRPHYIVDRAWGLEPRRD